MKKLRKLLIVVNALGFSTATAVIVVAWCSYSEKDTRTDISNNITSSIKLGQLSDNTVGAFKTALQANLITMQDLNIINIISTCDYNLYKTETTDAIEDSDIIANTSIAIDINAKGCNFTGQASNIIVSYNKKTNINTVIEQKDLINIYVGQSNKPNKTQILKAIKDKNINASRLTINDFNIKDSIGTRQTIIKGNGDYTGEATLEYTIINFENISIENIWQVFTIESIITKNNLIYVSTNGGLVYKSNGTGPFEQITGTSGLTSGAIWSLAVDSTNNIYAGSNNGSVYKSNGTDPFTSPMTGTSGAILSLAIDSTNNIYAGSDNGSVYKSNGTGPFTPMTGTSGAILSLAVDRTNNIYAGSRNGSVYKSNGTDPFTSPMTGTLGLIKSLAIDSTNNIYAGSDNGSVYKSNGTDPFTPITGTSGEILSLAVDSSTNNIYAGSDNGSVYKSNGTGPFTPITGTSGEIKSLAVDSSTNNIYAGGRSKNNPSIFISEK